MKAARFGAPHGYFVARCGVNRKASTERFNCLHSMKGKVGLEVLRYNLALIKMVLLCYDP